jgi:hypothetical protein
MHGESTEIHISTGHHSRRRHLLGWITAFHDKRGPLFNLRLVVGIFHSTVVGMSGESLESPFQKRDILRSSDKTKVRYGMNKGLRIFDRSLLHQIGPELTGKIELGVHLQSF